MSSLVPNRWQQASTPLAILTLLLNNLVPLFGVLVLNWELYPVILIYWLENGVIGAFNVLKMGVAQGTAPATEKEARFNEWVGARNLPIVRLLMRVYFIVFFVIHYGIFWGVHGVFVRTIFSEWGALSRGGIGGEPWLLDNPWGSTLWGAWGVIGAMIVSHGSSFVQNYLGRGEYTVATPAKLMAEPYGRVVVLHLTIIGGSILVASLGEPLYGILLLIALKTSVDLWAHLREHRHYHPPG